MITVECTGDFDLLDVANGTEINHGEPHTVENTWFVKSQIENGQLRKVKPEPPKAKAK